MRSTTLAVLLLTAGGAAAQKGPRPAKPPSEVARRATLKRVARGLDKPVAIAFAPGDASGRMFVVEQEGRVRIVRKDGTLEPTPFLDLSRQVTPYNRDIREQGLLGLTFHPRYAKNGYFYVNYTDREGVGNTRVFEYRVSKASPDRADPKSGREILMVEQYDRNHNGGHLAFGPDGKLYIGLGDGGSAGDPEGFSQDRSSFLGKMLRADVDAKAGVKMEMIQWGHRNPWRYSFDRKTGDLYIGDVGQEGWEEVNVLGAGDLVKKNLGWNIVEGMGHCYKPRSGCNQKGLVQPVVEYSTKNEGCSVVGGHVYRGKALPELDGVYFYADFCSALIRSFRWQGGKAVDSWEWRDVLDPGHKIGSFTTWGEDLDGELYLASYDGAVYKLVRK